MINNKTIYMDSAKKAEKQVKPFFDNNKWKIGTNLQLNKTHISKVSRLEQNTIISIDRLSDSIVINSSDTRYITLLSKNPLFVVCTLTYNPKYSKIVDITGTIPSNGITIRKSIKNVDFEHQEVKE